MKNFTKTLLLLVSSFVGNIASAQTLAVVGIALAYQQLFLIVSVPTYYFYF